MRRVAPAITVTALAALIGGSAVLGPSALAGVLLLMVVALASGWPTLLGLPIQRGSTTVLALCGAVGVLTVLLTSTPDSVAPLRWASAVLALSIVVTFAHQLMRRDTRPRLVESVAGVVSGVVVLQLGVGWLPASHQDFGLVISGVLAMAVGSMVLMLPLPRRLAGVSAMVAGTAAAGIVSLWLDFAAINAVLTGLCVAVVQVSIDRLFDRLSSAASRHAGMAVGAAEVCTVGMVVYLIGAVVV